MELVLNDGGINKMFFSKIVRVLKLGYKSSHAGGGDIMVDLIDKFQNRKFVRIS